jgi:MATE family multidrug resistance protein
VTPGSHTWKERWLAPGGGWELLRLALPFILSNLFWTLQITIDRILLYGLGSEAVAAYTPAVTVFWTPLILLQTTAAYASTFVAQYIGAGRPHRIGPAVWQSLYFAVVTGVLLLGLIPLAPLIFQLAAHAPPLPELETTYFCCLCYSALPFLVTAAASSFFAGRGDSWTVMLINVAGLVVNAVFASLLIFGYGGLPRLEIAGAGWATVIGTSVSALLALVLMLRPAYRTEFATASGWRPDFQLLGRLLYYGLPGGVQVGLDVFAFALFTVLVARLGTVEAAATSIAFAVNMLAFMPPLGIGLAVQVLVGQRLGENRPDLAARSTWTAFRLAWLYMAAVALLYVLLPDVFLWIFQSKTDQVKRSQVAALVPGLLRFVAVYSLFDSMTAVFSFALKGAGDTLFVSLAAVVLSWPLMVVPTWLAWYYHWGLWWAWTFASSYVIALGLTFLVRFRMGRWRSMRVIEKQTSFLGKESP